MLEKFEQENIMKNINIEEIISGLGGYEAVGSAKGVKRIPKKKKKKVVEKVPKEDERVLKGNAKKGKKVGKKKSTVEDEEDGLYGEVSKKRRKSSAYDGMKDELNEQDLADLKEIEMFEKIAGIKES